MKIAKYVLISTLSIYSASSVAMGNNIEHYTTPENIPLGMPFSEAVRAGNTVYLAGQIGVRPGETKVVPGGIEAEGEQAIKNIELALQHFNLTLTNVVKCQVMLVDITEWSKFNAV